MTKVISFVNAKGGVGKTTTSVNVAAGMANKGFKTLLIDLDPQGNATSYFEPEGVKFDISDLLLGKAKFSEVVQNKHKLDIIPVTTNSARLENALTMEMNGALKLFTATKKVLDKYDFVIIDCPPALGNITANGLLISDYYIVPLVPEPFAIKGISDLNKFVDQIKQVNEDLKFMGFLFNRYNRKKRNSTHQAIEQHILDTGLPVFKTSIREDKVLYDVVLTQTGHIFGEPGARNCVMDFNALCEEIINLN